jgi:hypothetical protein
MIEHVMLEQNLLRAALDATKIQRIELAGSARLGVSGWRR